MNSLERMWMAINDSCKNPPIVIPYLQYYFPEVVAEVTPFSRADLEDGSLDKKVDALSLLHEYFDCDWVRVTTDPPWAVRGYGKTASETTAPTIPAEQLLEEGIFDVTIELTRRFREEKFIYGRVGIPYGVLFADFSDIAGAMIALKIEPERCKRAMEESIPQRLEEIRAWAEVGVHGLWLGQWLCSADMISEADYLEFVHPYDQIMVDAVKSVGLVPIYHFCGDVVPRLKHIRKTMPTVFGVEESKKGFDVDIGRVRAGMGDEFCLLGNIDVYDIVERGSEEVWASEVTRQIRAGGPERFIVSCGSPITHDTSPQRLRDFIATAKEVRDRFE
jgi:hypothetical protein